MDTPIVDFVRGYAQSGTSRLHMPGHKGQSLLGFEPLDLTEIRGADELYEPEGIIAQSEATATRLFGTQHTYYSTEGSSQCIRAMLCLALQAAPRTGKRPVLLAARNAHKALLYAAALLDFDIRWLWPAAENAGALCSCPVTAGQLEQALERLSGQGRTPFGVYVTSPDYLGGMQDIAALSKVCDAHGVPLLVDNAHGAYLNFLVGGSKHPMALGAAMCCDSGHKTLPVLTGGAYLHLGLKAPVQDETAVRNALALFGSTSPSYLILQSLDRCNRYLSEGYPLRLYSCCGQLTRLRRVLNEAAAAVGSKLSLAVDDPAREPLKLTLDAAALGLTGLAGGAQSDSSDAAVGVQYKLFARQSCHFDGDGIELLGLDGVYLIKRARGYAEAKPQQGIFDIPVAEEHLLAGAEHHGAETVVDVQHNGRYLGVQLGQLF